MIAKRRLLAAASSSRLPPSLRFLVLRGIPEVYEYHRSFSRTCRIDGDYCGCGFDCGCAFDCCGAEGDAADKGRCAAYAPRPGGPGRLWQLLA
jgi:hypothetical protein